MSPQNMARNMVLTYLHFGILKFPLNGEDVGDGYLNQTQWDDLPTYPSNTELDHRKCGSIRQKLSRQETPNSVGGQKETRPVVVMMRMMTDK